MYRDELNKLIGYLTTERTISNEYKDHYSFYINKISELRNKMFNNELECEDCFGLCCSYEKEAQSCNDGVCCEECNGSGFNIKFIKSELNVLRNSRSSLFNEELELILSHKSFINK